MAAGCVTGLVPGMNEPCNVRVMYRSYVKTIVFWAIFAIANYLGAQSEKGSTKIGSAAVARAYASVDRGPVASSMVLHNMSILLQPGDARRADLNILSPASKTARRRTTIGGSLPSSTRNASVVPTPQQRRWQHGCNPMA